MRLQTLTNSVTFENISKFLMQKMNPNSKCPKLPWMIDFHSSDKGQTLDRQYKAAFANTAFGHLSSLSHKSRPSCFKLTQLICTLPSEPCPSDIESLILSGVSLVRISTPKTDTIKETMKNVRSAVEAYSRKIGRVYSLGIALEITSPVIRTGRNLRIA